jgi:hypothetical protein
VVVLMAILEDELGVGVELVGVLGKRLVVVEAQVEGLVVE